MSGLPQDRYRASQSPGCPLEGVNQTWFITKMTFVSIVKIFEGVCLPRTWVVILIAQMAGRAGKGWHYSLHFLHGILSIQLGVLNLLPFLSSTGHLLFYIIEAIRGKDLSVKWKERAQQIGFILLIMLMIFVVIMDIDRLNIGVVNDVTRFFTK